ncbi:hypothetical protein M441DRAFT_241016 [Trichoderma asperellum CBS 433.97]|uniref:Uncharacterized protein n=1 Tax=Trichoderma asperellum (strain ATCC 204424 / CBS 433.97 / NBRC 101777) TaxID=1042311 RepID=A0A2T3Z269_TRIA4|nr:hypothetical protein M441DRAFT_241016 [Trichoderma asperellum CBS 433.97]PTB38904.1 hypothetical protein M441DRAFT_241016 [Trichoderma asperellum CBS 433.97]
MERFSLAHAREPIIAGVRQLYSDPARLTKQAFWPSGVDGVAEEWMFYSLGACRTEHLLLLGERLQQRCRAGDSPHCLASGLALRKYSSERRKGGTNGNRLWRLQLPQSRMFVPRFPFRKGIARRKHEQSSVEHRSSPYRPAGWRASIDATSSNCSGATTHSPPQFLGVANVQMRQSGYCIGELRQRWLRVGV